MHFPKFERMTHKVLNARKSWSWLVNLDCLLSVLISLSSRPLIRCWLAIWHAALNTSWHSSTIFVATWSIVIRYQWLITCWKAQDIAAISTARTPPDYFVLTVQTQNCGEIRSSNYVLPFPSFHFVDFHLCFEIWALLERKDIILPAELTTCFSIGGIPVTHHDALQKFAVTTWWRFFKCWCSWLFASWLQQYFESSAELILDP